MYHIIDSKIAVMSAFSNAFYNAVAKRNSVFVSTVFAGAFAFGVGFDVGVNSLWDSWNKGKQWKDIRAKYLTTGGDDDE